MLTDPVLQLALQLMLTASRCDADVELSGAVDVVTIHTKV